MYGIKVVYQILLFDIKSHNTDGKLLQRWVSIPSNDFRNDSFRFLGIDALAVCTIDLNADNMLLPIIS